MSPPLGDSVHNGVDHKHIKAIEVLISGGTTERAGEAAGVTGRTVRRWLREDQAFTDALRQAQHEALAACLRKLRACGELAVKTLADVMRDPNAADAVKVSAARAVLEGLKWTEVEDLARRMAQLEEVRKHSYN